MLGLIGGSRVGIWASFVAVIIILGGCGSKSDESAQASAPAVSLAADDLTEPSTITPATESVAPTSQGTDDARPDAA